jgi:hypothetical protein
MASSLHNYHHRHGAQISKRTGFEAIHGALYGSSVVMSVFDDTLILTFAAWFRFRILFGSRTLVQTTGQAAQARVERQPNDYGDLARLRCLS